MAEKALGRKAGNTIKSNLVDLSEIIESNLSKTILRCEQEKIISSNTKKKLSDPKTGQSDLERASYLVSEVQTAVKYCPEKLEPFLITIFNIDTLHSKRLAIKLANKYGECMPQFIETVDDSGDDDVIPLLKLRPTTQLSPQTGAIKQEVQVAVFRDKGLSALDESLIEDNRVDDPCDMIEDNREDDNIQDDFSFRRAISPRPLLPSPQKQSPLFEYDMTAEDDKSRGIALIINNKTWRNDKEGLYTRHGSEKDVEAVMQTIKSLQYQSFVYNDLTADEMKQAVQRASEKVKAYHKSFVCCIMSHGSDDGIEGVDDMVVTATDLARCINLQHLVGKPKLFIIQACRGEDTPRDLVAFDAKEDEDRVKVKAVPPAADYLFAYSTTPSTKSMRHKEEGSFYIQLLCKNLQQFRKTCSLYEIILMVHNELATSNKLSKEMKTGGRYRQIGEVISTLRGKIYFK